MKLCVVGASGHTSYVMEALPDERDVEWVGVAPACPEENIERLCMQAAIKGYHPTRQEDYVRMLDTLKPDVVAIACHFHLHATVAIQALERGIHVFVEKPVATTLDDLQLVKRAYARSGAHLAAMFGIRYKPAFLTAKQYLDNGAIGSVRLMQAQKSYKLGQRSDFFKSRNRYGGTIPWVGSHAIDWMHWYSGEKFHSVYASHSTRGNQNHGELEATALCHFVFGNDVFGSVSIDYLRPVQAPSHDDDRIRIVGTGGVLEIRDQKLYLINEKVAGVRELPLLSGQKIFSDFLRQVRGEGACMITAEQSFMVTEACLKARQSADEGRLVHF